MKIRSDSVSSYHQSFGNITALWDWDYAHEQSALKTYLVKYAVVHLWLIPDVEKRDQVLRNSSFLLSMFEDYEHSLLALRTFRALSIKVSQALFEEVISNLDHQTYVRGVIRRDPRDMKYHRAFLRYGVWLDNFVLFLSHNGFPVLGMRLAEFQLQLVGHDTELEETRIDILEHLMWLYDVLELDDKAQHVRGELMLWYETKRDNPQFKYNWLKLQFHALEKIEDKIQNIHQRMELTSDPDGLLALEYDLIDFQRLETKEYSAELERDVQNLLQRIPPENKPLMRRCLSLQCEILLTKEEISAEELLFIETTSTETLQYYIEDYGKEHPKSLKEMKFVSDFYSKIGAYEQSLQYLLLRHPSLVRIYGEEHIFLLGNLLEQGICNIELRHYEDVSRVVHEFLQLSKKYEKKIFDQEDRYAYFAELIVVSLWGRYSEHKTTQAKTCIVQGYRDLAQNYRLRGLWSRALWRCWYRIYFFHILQSRVLRFIWEIFICLLIMCVLFMIVDLIM